MEVQNFFQYKPTKKLIDIIIKKIKIYVKFVYLFIRLNLTREDMLKFNILIINLFYRFANHVECQNGRLSSRAYFKIIFINWKFFILMKYLNTCCYTQWSLNLCWYFCQFRHFGNHVLNQKLMLVNDEDNKSKWLR